MNETEQRISEPRSTEDIFKSLRETIEQNPRPDSEIDRIEKERTQADIASRIANLRSNWNAPTRQVATKPKLEGPWLEKMNLINSKMGAGTIFGLVGIRGCGKTQLGVEAMRHVTKNLRSAYFTTALQFFMEIKSTYRKDASKDESQIIGKFRKYSLLVIDEIGKRGESEWENNMLFELINWRYNDMKDTILIDNRTKQEFVETIGPSLASRMQECGGIIECGWESFRT